MTSVWDATKICWFKVLCKMIHITHVFIVYISWNALAQAQSSLLTDWACRSKFTTHALYLNPRWNNFNLCENSKKIKAWTGKKSYLSNHTRSISSAHFVIGVTPYITGCFAVEFVCGFGFYALSYDRIRPYTF